MDSCTVSASELFQRAKEMLNDGNTHVTITLVEPDEELPASVSFEAWKAGSDYSVGYDSIESIDA